MHGARRGPRAAGATRPAHPHRGETPAHARADRAPRRRLEPRLVRRPGRPLARRPGRLEAACAAVGRDPATLERTVGVNVVYPDLVAASGATGPETPPRRRWTRGDAAAARRTGRAGAAWRRRDRGRSGRLRRRGHAATSSRLWSRRRRRPSPGWPRRCAPCAPRPGELASRVSGSSEPPTEPGRSRRAGPGRTCPPSRLGRSAEPVARPAGHELATQGRDGDRLARARAAAPDRVAVRIERVVDDGPRDPEVVGLERVGRGHEAAHDPGVPAAPDEQPDRAAGGRRSPRRPFASPRPSVVVADQVVRPGAQDVQPGGPAPDAGALALAGRRGANRSTCGRASGAGAGSRPSGRGPGSIMFSIICMLAPTHWTKFVWATKSPRVGDVEREARRAAGRAGDERDEQRRRPAPARRGGGEARADRGQGRHHVNDTSRSRGGCRARRLLAVSRRPGWAPASAPSSPPTSACGGRSPRAGRARSGRARSRPTPGARSSSR